MKSDKSPGTWLLVDHPERPKVTNSRSPINARLGRWFPSGESIPDRSELPDGSFHPAIGKVQVALPIEVGHVVFAAPDVITDSAPHGLVNRRLLVGGQTFNTQ